MVIQSSGDRITRYMGIDSDPVNQGWLCDKGRFSYEASNHEDRLRGPLHRIVLRRISNRIFATDCIRWLSGMGVSSHGKMPANRG